MPKHKTRNTKNLGSKHNLLVKFGQFMPYYKRKRFIKKLYKNCDLKTSRRPFCVSKNYAQPLLENEIFEASYLH